MSTASPALSTEQLAQTWARVSRQHLALGMACGCGIGFSISAQDLEEDLCDYVESLARGENREDLIETISQLNSSADRGWRLSEFLALLPRRATPETLDFLLPRLMQSLASLDQAHPRARFACSG